MRAGWCAATFPRAPTKHEPISERVAEVATGSLVGKDCRKFADLQGVLKYVMQLRNGSGWGFAPRQRILEYFVEKGPCGLGVALSVFEHTVDGGTWRVYHELANSRRIIIFYRIQSIDI